MTARMLVLAAAMLLVVPVVALAKSYKLKGTFGNDDNATVSLKVKLGKAKKGKKGKPSKVSGFAVTKINYRCSDDVTAGELDIKVPGSIKVKYDKSVPGYIFRKDTTVSGRTVEIFGKVSKSGKKADGEFSVEFQNGPTLQCANGALGWRAKK